MAKSNKNKTNKSSRRGKRSPYAAGSRPCPSKGLDANAARYAELLVNPCDGPLVTGPFGDGSGGFLSRFEADYIIGNDAADRGTYISFVPSNSIVYTAPVGAVTGDTVVTTPILGLAPANAFLAANADQFRCVAACMQLYWPGTELNRAGIVGAGQLAAGTFGTSVNTAALRTNLQHVERMPEDMVELVWRPNDYDLNWNNTDTLDNIGKRSSMTYSVAGIPGGVGVRVRIVGVYEWIPVLQQGMVAPTRDSNPSSNTFTDVLNYADSLGQWMFHSSSHAAQALSSLWSGGVATKKLLHGGIKMASLLM